MIESAVLRQLDAAAWTLERSLPPILCSSAIIAARSGPWFANPDTAGPHRAAPDGSNAPCAGSCNATLLRVDASPLGQEVHQAFGGGLGLGTVKIAVTKKRLTLQVARLHHVKIHDADFAHPGRGKILQGRTTESA